MRLALISLDQRWQDREENLRRCQPLLARAAEHGATAAILPEMTLTGFSMKPEIVSEDASASPSLQGFAAASKQSGLELVFGACLRDGSNDRPRNVMCLATPDGAARVVYAKLHPFSFAGEDEIFAAGDAIGYAPLTGLRLGASICYDLRFPALYSAMAAACEAAVCIANWPEGRIHHWHALLVARAIENQMYMIGVNRIGIDGNGLRYAPSTVVIAPDGGRVEPLVAEEELQVHDIDPAIAARYRAKFPTLRDRRLDLYRTFEGAPGRGH
jgi:omega-amidase